MTTARQAVVILILQREYRIAQNIPHGAAGAAVFVRRGGNGLDADTPEIFGHFLKVQGRFAGIVAADTDARPLIYVGGSTYVVSEAVAIRK